MSNFKQFMKQNQIKKENVKYPATKSLLDEEGKPLEWELRAITTAENDAIRDSCTADVDIIGRPGLFREKLDSTLYVARLIAESVVFPSLIDKELQNSYGVVTAEMLVKEMICDPGEYGNFAEFIQNYNGFSSIQDKVDEAKN